MKALRIATTLALLGGPAAHAGTIIDTVIPGSDSRLKVEDCGADTCGTLSWGEQKFILKKSDIVSFFNNLDVAAQPQAKQRAKSPERADRAKPKTAPAARSDDWSVPSGRRDEPAAARSQDAAAARIEEKPGSTTLAKEAPVEQKGTVTRPLAAPVAAEPNSPIGEWTTEDGDGRVRIHPCGQALCGVISATSNPNETDRRNPDASKRDRPVIGLRVLIDMKPLKNDRWEGQIYDPREGKTYASKIALKNPDVLRVEGCLLGGLLCDAQNWTRVKGPPQG